eukprot:GEMP01005140.1.p1 GENE.GEMP01005140.1~~GEMP01005140.1.p1  ORF type:complete len:935 (-),score=149.39 GEMP01005140.1:920-3724(-)
MQVEASKNNPTITLCICAMWRCREKGSVKALVERLESHNVQVIWLDETVFFDDEVFTAFPSCIAIWTLYSPDLPLTKVSMYVERCQCLELNSIEGLQSLRDRRTMFRVLVANGIPVPFHIECNRDESGGDGEGPTVEEFDDYIVIGNEKITKPFLEKPADADNHEVYIYYPRSAGGGKTRLDKNMAVFEERGRIRRNGSYIYEKFITSEGFETRLFVISSVVNDKDHTYIFAEAKTCVPATVTESGRRVPRYAGGLGNSVLAHTDEKLACPKIAKAFGQTTFKVDILRSQTADSEEKFFVYDVSVKGGALKNRGSTYFDEVAHVLYTDLCGRLKLLVSESTLVRRISSPVSARIETEKTACSGRSSPYEELMCVWSLVRHGDRTPKRKLKLQFACEDPFTAGWLLGWLQGGEIQETLYKFFREQRETSKVVELRSTQQLQRLFLILKEFEKRPQRPPAGSMDSSESDSVKASTLLFSSDPHDVLVIRSAVALLGSAFSTKSESQQFPHAKVEVQSTCIKVNLKWGGELTALGRQQAFRVGERFRRDNFPFEDAAQLHATLRHDVKVYSSAEPRCRQTAGSFTKGFLDLRGPLPQIIVSFVRNDGLGRLTDAPFRQAPLYSEIKQSVTNLLEAAPVDFVSRPECHVRASVSLRGLEQEFGRIGLAVLSVLEKMDTLVTSLENIPEFQVSHMETSSMMALRWADLRSEVAKDHGALSHCLDNTVYDVRHNLPFFEDHPEIQKQLLTIKELTSRLTEFLGQYEFGRSNQEKTRIAAHYVSPLIRKLRWDLRVASGSPLGDEKDALMKHNDLYGSSNGWRPIRTRLYFAHSSHMQTLVNVLRCGSQEFKSVVADCLHFPPDLGRLGYCSHLIIKLFRSADTYVARFFLSTGDGLDSDPDKEPPFLGEVPMIALDDFLSKVIDFASEEEDAKCASDAKS